MPEEEPKVEKIVEALVSESPKLEETPKTLKKKSKLPLLLGVFVTLLFMLVLIVWYSRPLEKLTQSNYKTEPTSAILVNTSDPISLLLAIRDKLRLTESIREEKYYVPRLSNNNQQLSPGSYTSGKKISVQGEELDPTTGKVAYFGNAVSTFLLENHFEPEKSLVSDTYSYTKGDVLCQYYEGYKFFSIYCGKTDANYQSLVDEISPYVQKSQGKAEDFVKVSLNNSYEDFVTGRYKVAFIAKKEGGGWSVLLSMVDSPICSEIEKFNLPIGYFDCYLNSKNSTKRSELKNAPLYPSIQFLSEEKLGECKEEPYNIRMCESTVFNFKSTDPFDKILKWYEDDFSESGWKLSGGAGTDGERIGSLINNKYSENNLGIKITRGKNETLINIYVPNTSRVH